MNTIIELKSVYDYSDDNEEKYISKSLVGYYSCYERVEEVIKYLSEKDDSYIMFLTDEYSIDELRPLNDDGFKNWHKTRQYKFINGSVVMIHETPKNYKGHIKSKYDYKSGDIIEWIDGHSNVYTGIVAMCPPSIEGLKHIHLVDSMDDSYLVYLLGDGDTHEHIATVNIIGYADITPDKYKQYKDKLLERTTARN